MVQYGLMGQFESCTNQQVYRASRQRNEIGGLKQISLPRFRQHLFCQMSLSLTRTNLLSLSLYIYIYCDVSIQSNGESERGVENVGGERRDVQTAIIHVIYV